MILGYIEICFKNSYFKWRKIHVNLLKVFVKFVLKNFAICVGIFASFYLSAFFFSVCPFVKIPLLRVYSEGFLTCYVDSIDMMWSKLLRLYPRVGSFFLRPDDKHPKNQWCLVNDCVNEENFRIKFRRISCTLDVSLIHVHLSFKYSKEHNKPDSSCF